MPSLEFSETIAQLLEKHAVDPSTIAPWYLSEAQGLTLSHRDDPTLFLNLDFIKGSLGYRTQKRRLEHEPVLKAVGVSPKSAPRVVDATAGLGRDGLLMACAGCEVLQIEMQPILALMLEEAKLRAQQSAAEFADVAARLSLVQADAAELLPSLEADVVYLDPMYPGRKKSAAVKREMQVLHALLPQAPEPSYLLDAALAGRSKRIVVKRPKTAEAIYAKYRSGSIKSGATRFDIYPGPRAGAKAFD